LAVGPLFKKERGTANSLPASFLNFNIFIFSKLHCGEGLFGPSLFYREGCPRPGVDGVSHHFDCAMKIKDEQLLGLI